MKKILVLLFFIFVASCGDNEEIIPLEKITDSKNIFTIQDFKSIKFKESKNIIWTCRELNLHIMDS